MGSGFFLPNKIPVKKMLELTFANSLYLNIHRHNLSLNFMILGKKSQNFALNLSSFVSI